MPDSTPKKKVSQLVAAEYVWEILLAVALPPTVFAFLGRWLDKRFHHTHLFTLIGFFLALIVVVRLMLEKAQRFKEIYHDSTTSEEPSQSPPTSSR